MINQYIILLGSYFFTVFRSQNIYRLVWYSVTLYTLPLHPLSRRIKVKVLCIRRHILFCYTFIIGVVRGVGQRRDASSVVRRPSTDPGNARVPRQGASGHRGGGEEESVQTNRGGGAAGQDEDDELTRNIHRRRRRTKHRDAAVSAQQCGGHAAVTGVAIGAAAARVCGSRAH